MVKGDEIPVVGPLGNGFTLKRRKGSTYRRWYRNTANA